MYTTYTSILLLLMLSSNLIFCKSYMNTVKINDTVKKSLEKLSLRTFCKLLTTVTDTGSDNWYATTQVGKLWYNYYNYDYYDYYNYLYYYY